MKRLILGALILYASVFFVDFLISKWIFFHYGKDDGLVFRVITVSLFSSLFFYIIKNNFSLHIGLGFFIGLLSYLLIFALYICSNILNGGDNSGFVLPMIGDQLAATTIVFIVGVIYWFVLKRKRMKD